MRTISAIILLLSLALASGGCGHTNELAKYPTAGLEYETQVRISTEAGDASVSVAPPTGNAFADILAAIGSGVTSAEAVAKLRRAVKPMGVAGAISEAFEQDAQRYLDIRPAKAPDGKPAFSIRTYLDQLQLQSHAEGIFLHVKSEITVISLSDGTIVWQDEEETDAPIRQTQGASLDPVAGTIAGIVNASQLLALSEAEIQDAVLSAARDVGMQIGEVLREDVAKLHKR